MRFPVGKATAIPMGAHRDFDAGVLGLVVAELYPALVQRFQVEPSELARETAAAFEGRYVDPGV